MNEREKSIAYILSRFPTISETFILYEIIELRKMGFDIHIYPLVQEKGEIVHPEVESLAASVAYTRIFSKDTFKCHLKLIRKDPINYLRVCFGVLSKNIWSFKFFTRAIVVLLLSAPIVYKISNNNIQLIHAHSATHPTLMAYTLHEFTGIPYIFSAHSTDIYFNKTMLREKISKSSLVRTISEYNKRYLESLFPEIPSGKIIVIYCGIYQESFNNAINQVKGDPLRILCVARLEEIKGHKYLIDALAHLKINNHAFHCDLVGDGKARSRIKHQIRKYGLDNSISLLGFRTHDEIVAILQKSDIFILPSVSEGIPIAVMEAMAASLPVVATSITGMAELIEDGISGLLVPAKNSKRLGNAIISLLENESYRKSLGMAAKSRIGKKFDIRYSARLIGNLFNEILSR